MFCFYGHFSTDFVRFFAYMDISVEVHTCSSMLDIYIEDVRESSH